MVCGMLGLNQPNKRYRMAKAVKVDGVLQLAHALVCLEGGRCVSLSDWSTRSTKSNSRCGAAHYGSSSVNRVGWSSKQRPRGPMDKASAHGAGDCRFESCRGQPHCQKTHVVMFSWSAYVWLNGSSSMPLALVCDVDRAGGSIGMHLPSFVLCDLSMFVLCIAGLLCWQWSSLRSL